VAVAEKTTFIPKLQSQMQFKTSAKSTQTRARSAKVECESGAD